MPDTAPPFSGRTYFLGAGASKAFYPQLPLASELTLSRLLTAQAYLKPPRQSISALERFRDRVGLDPSILNSPIENVTAVQDFLPHDKDNGYPYESLFNCILRRLDHGDGFHYPLMNWLRDVSNRRDVVITTNYDSVLEWNCEFPNPSSTLPYKFGVTNAKVIQGAWPSDYTGAPEKRIRLLKLHGSVSWSHCSACGFYCLDPLHESGAEDALNGIGNCQKCPVKGSREPVFILPFLRKDYSDNCIQEIWSSAEGFLRRAEELYFVGFSLSPTDYKIRALLKEAHLQARTRRVTLIDHHAHDLLQRYRDEIYGDIVTVCAQPGWKQYLKSSYPSPFC